MSGRAYGKMPRGGRKGQQQQEPGIIRLHIERTQTLEQFALEVQRAVAMLQDYGATGLQGFTAELLPLDEQERPMLLRDGAGEPVTAIHIPAQAKRTPYSDDEPGVEATPAQPRTPRESAAPTTAQARAPNAIPPRR